MTYVSSAPQPRCAALSPPRRRPSARLGVLTTGGAALVALWLALTAPAVSPVAPVLPVSSVSSPGVPVGVAPVGEVTPAMAGDRPAVVQLP